jgi:hypothetical protein
MGIEGADVLLASPFITKVLIFVGEDFESLLKDLLGDLVGGAVLLFFGTSLPVTPSSVDALDRVVDGIL